MSGDPRAAVQSAHDSIHVHGPDLSAFFFRKKAKKGVAIFARRTQETFWGWSRPQTTMGVSLGGRHRAPSKIGNP
jgi:hypothetical protein